MSLTDERTTLERIVSWPDYGQAFAFVTREQGDELTRIEIRVNKELTEYTVSEYEAYRQRGPRPTVNTVA